MKNFSSFQFNLVWRPFQLNPDMPMDGIERKKYLEIKFNGADNAKNIYNNIYKVGLDNNIHFQFDKITTTPNSFQSHKLLALAFKFKKQTNVAETLFYSYFIEGVDIGKTSELIKIAKHHKIYNDATINYLKSEEDNESLLSEQTHANELGIRGVPCFIINKEYVLYGAQDEKNFINIFNNFLK